jgi:hypothetical protein
MNETENKSTFWSQFFIWAAVICLCAFVAALVIPNFFRAHARPRYNGGVNACVNQLRLVDQAINQWALANGKTNGTVVTWSDIKPYLRLDATGNFQGCPAGGKYTLGKVGDVPQVTCSLTTLPPPYNGFHALP